LNYTPVGEDVPPPYYFTPDPNHSTKPTDPCSPNGEEDYAGDVEGLDNDGDNAYDEAADGDCAPPCEPPIAARSCNLHGTFDCCLDIGPGCEGADPGDNVEPRFCGVNELCVDFAGPVDAASLAVAVACTDGGGFPVPYVGTITPAQDDPDTVCIDFNPNLPNNEPTCCEVSFTGSGCGQWSVASAPGDVSRDRVVTVSDKALVKAKIGEPLDGTNCSFDVSCDGSITVSDKSLVKAKVGSSIPCCP
jgi:hypothetical protein